MSSLVLGAEHLDPIYIRAIQEIEATYGDTVSIISKNKSLRKWGKNPDLSNSAYETLWVQGGNEVDAVGDSITTVSSSSVSDSQTMVVEGFTGSGTGEGVKYTFHEQEVTLNGRNKVTLDTPITKATRTYNYGATDLDGVVYIYEDTAISNGVPSDATKIHLVTETNQSFKAATTISDSDYWIITQVSAGVNKRASDSVDFLVQLRAPGKVWRDALPIIASSGGPSVPSELSTPIIVPRNYDMRIVAQSGSNGTEAAAWVSGPLAAVT